MRITYQPHYPTTAVFLFLVWLSACTPARHFDYKTHGGFDFSNTENATAANAENSGSINAISDPQQAASDLTAALPAGTLSQSRAATPAALPKKEGKQLLKEVRKEVKQALKANRKELKKAIRQGKKPAADHPLNDGITAALLLLGLGVLLLLLAAILPSLISVIGWILGIAVLLIGVTFLVLALFGFEVHIIG